MKIISESNFRVEVYPKTTVYGFTVAEEKDVCEDILKDIKRHVNEVQGSYIVCDRNPVCSYCGSKWTEDGEEYNGGCCQKDIDNENLHELKVEK